MKVSYKGIRKALPAKLQEKLDAKFAKLSKLLERRGEREARVVVTTQRHLQCAEVTIQFYDHQLAAVEKDADVFTAVYSALEKLEKQAVSQRGKWREKGRRSAAPSADGIKAPKAAASAPKKSTPKNVSSAPTAGAIRQQIYKVNHRDGSKPMTLDEALIEMEQDRDYLVYRDASKRGVSVLVRRRDGHFDLIES